MTQVAITPAEPERDPVRLVGAEGGLSGDARALLARGLLAPAREFDALPEHVKVGGTYAGAQEAISRAHGVDNRSGDELAVGRIIRDARNTEDTKTLHAMSHGETGGVTDPVAIEWGKTAANRMLDNISNEHAKRGPATGRVVMGKVVGRATVPRSLQEGGGLPDSGSFARSRSLTVNLDNFYTGKH